ncbi:MAG TPA: TobH protein, partial [Mycobacterium sp.]|nr:TobH protein [Mycobacterium sp.]
VPDLPDGVGGPDGSAGSDRTRGSTGAGRAEQQLAVLAVRLEMAAVYMRLVRG